MITKIKIDGSKLNTPERREKVRIVQEEMHQIINSRVFQDKVLMMNKSGEISKFKNLPNSAIYEMVMKGAEVLDPVVDHELDIYVDDYFSWKRVIGYTYRSVKTIFVNTRYFDKRTTKLIGSNILHEYGHKLGFSHDFNRTARRPYSICYRFNRIYEECYDQIFYNARPVKTKKVKHCYRSWKTLWFKKYCYYKEVAVNE